MIKRPLDILIITGEGHSLGNVIAALFQHTARLPPDTRIRSMSLTSHPPAPTRPQLRDILHPVGIEPDQTTGMAFSRSALISATHVLVQDNRQKQHLMQQFPDCRHKIFRVAQWSSRELFEPDPDDRENLLDVITRISESIGGWCAALNRAGARSLPQTVSDTSMAPVPSYRVTGGNTPSLYRA